MKSVGLVLPDKESCSELDDYARPILEQQETLERENHKLATLRDALLPKLMSGEIDVSKIDLTQLNSHLTLAVAGCQRWFLHARLPAWPVLQVSAFGLPSP